MYCSGQEQGISNSRAPSSTKEPYTASRHPRGLYGTSWRTTEPQEALLRPTQKVGQNVGSSIVPVLSIFGFQP